MSKLIEMLKPESITGITDEKFAKMKHDAHTTLCLNENDPDCVYCKDVVKENPYKLTEEE